MKEMEMEVEIEREGGRVGEMGRWDRESNDKRR